MTKEEALKKLADIIFYAAKSGYMPYDTNDELCAMNIAKKHIDDFYTSLPSNLDEAMEEEAQHAYGEPTAQGFAKRSFFKRGFKAGVEWHNSKTPKLPDNLDEAAEEIASDIAPTHPDIGCDECFEKIKDGIKAGAEWMAAQGETVEGYIAGTNEVAAILAIPRKEHNNGDKVIVQIRKKQ